MKCQNCIKCADCAKLERDAARWMAAKILMMNDKEAKAYVEE